MLYISPLPFFLALGMERCLTIAKRLVAPVYSTGILQRVLPVLSMAPFLAVGSGLFIFWESDVRLLLVAVALAFALLLILKLQNYRSLEVIIVSLLILLLFNAAFRTLFPLVLDPHNIFTNTR